LFGLVLAARRGLDPGLAELLGQVVLRAPGAADEPLVGVLDVAFVALLAERRRVRRVEVPGVIAPPHRRLSLCGRARPRLRCRALLRPGGRARLRLGCGALLRLGRRALLGGELLLRSLRALLLRCHGTAMIPLSPARWRYSISDSLACTVQSSCMW